MADNEEKTLLDEFAMAMAPALFFAAHDKPNAWGPRIISEQAYAFAHAMMAERDRNTPS